MSVPEIFSSSPYPRQQLLRPHSLLSSGY